MKRKKRLSHTKPQNSLTQKAFILVFFSALTFVFGLSFSLNQSSRVIQPLDFKVPILIGESDTTSLCLSPNYMLNAWYNIERMDTLTDTLDMSKPSLDKYAFAYSQWAIPEEPKHIKSSNDSLVLVVDTIHTLCLTKKPIWASFLFHRNFSDTAIVLQDDTLIQRVKSFPIYVVNLSTQTHASVSGQDGSLIMVVEAMNPTGEWLPIEYWSKSWCGNSYYKQFIPPRHLLMTRGIKCSGDFYTQCRMKLSNGKQDIYSNTFSMTINPTQFENPMEKD